MGVVSVAFEPGRGNDRKEIDGQKDADGCYDGSRQAGNEKTDEGDRDDDRTGCNHRHGYGVKELVIVQPAELLDDSLLQEWNDRQAAAEYKGAGFGEE